MNTNQATDSRIATARTLGTEAYAAGMLASPSLDAACMALLKGEPVGGAGEAILSAWVKGWHTANAANDAPSTDPTPFERDRAVQAVTDWAMAAAAHHVDLSDHPNPEFGMGLWQTFKADFPKASHERFGAAFRSHVINMALHTYRRTVELLLTRATRAAS